MTLISHFVTNDKIIAFKVLCNLIDVFKYIKQCESKAFNNACKAWNFSFSSSHETLNALYKYC